MRSVIKTLETERKRAFIFLPRFGHRNHNTDARTAAVFAAEGKTVWLAVIELNALVDIHQTKAALNMRFSRIVLERGVHARQRVGRNADAVILDLEQHLIF